jgi:hypothetical protein
MKLIVVAVLAVLVLGCSGCPKKKEADPEQALVFTNIEVVDRSRQADRPPGLTPKALEEHVRDKLTASKWIVSPKEAGSAAKAPYRFKLELGVGADRGASDAQDGPKKVVLVSARAAPQDELEGVQLRSSVVAKVPGGTTPSDLRNKVLKVVDSVLNEIIFQASLARGDERKVVKALEGKDPDRLASTIEIAAVRRVKPAVPSLIKLLKHKDERVADRSIGALISIGDRRAVKPLTRISRFRDTAKMAKILDGIGSLGGSEAIQYLEFVSTGHEDEDIRNLASEALARLKKRSLSNPTKTKKPK